MSLFADRVAGEIRAQSFQWADQFMGGCYLVNGDRPFTMWAGYADEPKTNNDWSLVKAGLTWRSIILTRGPERIKIALTKREKQILNAAWNLAKDISRIKTRDAKLQRQAHISQQANELRYV